MWTAAALLVVLLVCSPVVGQCDTYLDPNTYGSGIDLSMKLAMALSYSGSHICLLPGDYYDYGYYPNWLDLCYGYCTLTGTASSNTHLYMYSTESWSLNSYQFDLNDVTVYGGQNPFIAMNYGSTFFASGVAFLQMVCVVSGDGSLSLVNVDIVTSTGPYTYYAVLYIYNSYYSYGFASLDNVRVDLSVNSVYYFLNSNSLVSVHDVSVVMSPSYYARLIETNLNYYYYYGAQSTLVDGLTVICDPPLEYDPGVTMIHDGSSYNSVANVYNTFFNGTGHHFGLYTSYAGIYNIHLENTVGTSGIYNGENLYVDVGTFRGLDYVNLFTANYLTVYSVTVEDSYLLTAFQAYNSGYFSQILISNSTVDGSVVNAPNLNWYSFSVMHCIIAYNGQIGLNSYSIVGNYIELDSITSYSSYDLLTISAGYVDISQVTLRNCSALTSDLVVFSSTTATINEMTIVNCEGERGGALTVDSGSFSASGVTIVGNTGSQGGAVLVTDLALFSLNNFVLANNTATSIGGAAVCVQSSCSFYNGILSSNSASATGGIMALISPSSLYIHSVLVEDSASMALSALLVDTVTLNNVRIVGSGSSAVYLGGVSSALIDSSYILSNVTGRPAMDVFGTSLTIVNAVVMDFGGWTGETPPSNTAPTSEAPPTLTCSGPLIVSANSLVCSLAALNVGCESQCSASPSDLCSSVNGGGSADVSSNGCKAVCRTTGACVGEGNPGGGQPWERPDYAVPGCHLCGGLCASGPTVCLPEGDGGWCVDEDGGSSYSCTCLSGYEGDGVSSCTNINECELGTDTCLDPAQGGVCADTVGSFSCSCASGWTGDGFVCTNVNECSQGTDNCAVAEATCTDTVGSFQCDCVPQMWGSGVTCEPCPPLTATIGATGAKSILSCFCPVGYSRENDTLCVPCAPGHFLDSTGACFECGFDSVNNVTLSDTCYGCPPFSVPTADHTACECLSTHVPVASANNRFGFECALQCPPGTVIVNGIDCSPCAVGEYAVEVNAVNCLACPPFETTAGLGSSSPNDCFCRPGFNRSVETGTCNLVCEPGTWWESNFDGCSTCPPGSYTSGVSEPSCTPCPSFATTAANHSTSLTQCFCQESYVPVNRVSGPYGPCTLECPPGSRPLSPIECIECSSNTFNPEPTTQASECPPCEPNSASPPNSTSHFDCKCLTGFFTRTPETEPWLCESCPSGAVCFGGTEAPLAASGYAAVKGDPYAYAECVPASSCVFNGTCSIGYEGSFCATCTDGYFRSAGECVLCPRHPLVLFFLVLVAGLGVCAFMMYWNLQDFASDRFVSLLIGANILQIYGLYGQLGIDWPEFGQAFFNVLSITNFNLELFSPECTLKLGSPFVARWVTLMLVPFFFLFVLGVFHGLVSLFIVISGSRTSLTHAAVSSALFRSFIQFIVLSYLPLSSGVMSFFDCVPNGNPGEYVVTAARDQLCYTPQYNRVIGAAVFFMLLYPVGVPLALYALVRYKRKKLGASMFAIRYAFIVGRYRDGYFVYELSVMLRKLLVVVCLFFLSNSSYLRGAGAFVVLIASLGVHSQLKPYRLVMHNILETVCLFTASILITLVVSFSDGVWSTAMKNTVVTLILLVNILFIGFWVLWDIFLRSYVHEHELMGAWKSSFLFETTDKAPAPVLSIQIASSPSENLHTMTAESDSTDGGKGLFAQVPPSTSGENDVSYGGLTASPLLMNPTYDNNNNNNNNHNHNINNNNRNHNHHQSPDYISDQSHTHYNHGHYGGVSASPFSGPGAGGHHGLVIESVDYTLDVGSVPSNGSALALAPRQEQESSVLSGESEHLKSGFEFDVPLADLSPSPRPSSGAVIYVPPPPPLTIKGEGGGRGGGGGGGGGSEMSPVVRDGPARKASLAALAPLREAEHDTTRRSSGVPPPPPPASRKPTQTDLTPASSVAPSPPPPRPVSRKPTQTDLTPASSVAPSPPPPRPASRKPTQTDLTPASAAAAAAGKVNTSNGELGYNQESGGDGFPSPSAVPPRLGPGVAQRKASAPSLTPLGGRLGGERSPLAGGVAEEAQVTGAPSRPVARSTAPSRSLAGYDPSAVEEEKDGQALPPRQAYRS